jgi:tetratricopeptide (TPR) repeat protein
MLAIRGVVSYLLLGTNDSYKNRGTKIERNMKNSNEPILDMTYAGPTMGGMIVNLLSRYPTRSAFVNPDGTHITYDTIAQRIAYLLETFETLGLKRSDTIVQMCGNRADVFVVMAACYIGSFRSVALQPLGGIDDQLYILNNCEAKILIVDDTRLQRAKELKQRSTQPFDIFSHDKTSDEMGLWDKFDPTISSVLTDLSLNLCVQEHLVDGNDSGAANDMHLIGCAYRELKNYEKALEAFKESRALFKKLKEVINVARCDQKIAHCLTELGDAEGALISAQKSLDVFVTAHDHRRETYSSFELGKAQIASEQYEEALMTLENVLENVTESEFKDFEFIIDIERKISVTLTKLGRLDEADEIARRLDAVVEVIDED